MKDIKWIFILFATLAAASMIGIGVAIGERSIIGIILCILVLILVMGYGFKTKAKMREEGRL
ncbi:YlaF family protein [Heyndrickxia vini]|uniref:YlaF family protein n=1 Tax=Heyndrickxia vini TaxID=1476025 RepID=A0ABX7DY91_9BACI|nr:YlaF family protein [Heyndrickxia vini]QQZ08083.1 YlaF family protein [Heyndrickxia vini]